MGHLVDFQFRGRSLVTDVFIETGTFRGDSLMNAVAAGFRQLDSIECCERLYQAARRRFADYAHVSLHLGSSGGILPKITDPELATTFWLDAHSVSSTWVSSGSDSTPANGPSSNRFGKHCRPATSRPTTAPIISLPSPRGGRARRVGKPVLPHDEPAAMFDRS